jgi:hypothetical protein
LASTICFVGRIAVSRPDPKQAKVTCSVVKQPFWDASPATSPDRLVVATGDWTGPRTRQVSSVRPASGDRTRQGHAARPAPRPMRRLPARCAAAGDRRRLRSPRPRRRPPRLRVGQPEAGRRWPVASPVSWHGRTRSARATGPLPRRAGSADRRPGRGQSRRCRRGSARGRRIPSGSRPTEPGRCGARPFVATVPTGHGRVAARRRWFRVMVRGEHACRDSSRLGGPASCGRSGSSENPHGAHGMPWTGPTSRRLAARSVAILHAPSRT